MTLYDSSTTVTIKIGCMMNEILTILKFIIKVQQIFSFRFPVSVYRCYTCGGSGLVECQVCDTQGQLKCYIKLTVTWTTHKNDHIVERTALPDQLIRGAQGQQAFSDQRPRVIPVMTFPDRSVNEASQQLILSHSISFRNKMILMQVHIIYDIP